jgi:ATP-dependent Clp protease ATP-binding subunit ClpA
VGHEEGGQLTETVNKTPHCVLLLDEIEKAHPDILNVLLQIMDAGRLTDSQRRTSDFKNVILILTSNLGAQDVARGTIGLVPTPAHQITDEVLKKSFSPEFINRLDGVIHFKPLDEELLLKIVDKALEELQIQLFKKKVTCEITKAARKELLARSYDPKYGARPIARGVEQWIKRPLVDKLLFGELKNGGRVTIDFTKGEFKFTSQAPAPTSPVPA